MELKLREMRKARGITQTELGDAVGVSMRVVSGWERGETAMSLIDAARVADVFNCTLDELAGREWPDDLEGMSADERSLISLYRDSNPQGRASILAVAEAQPRMVAESSPTLPRPLTQAA